MKMNEMSRSEEKNYKLVDLIKFICAFLVIGIHTRQFLSVSDKTILLRCFKLFCSILLCMQRIFFTCKEVKYKIG